MGSYLTIVNDTKDPWLCRLTDELPLVHDRRMHFIGIRVSTTLTALFSTPIKTALMSSATLSGYGNNVIGGYWVYNLPPNQLATTTTKPGELSAVKDNVTEFGIQFANGFTNALNSDGYDTILGGGKKRYGMTTLFRPQQALCVKTTIDGTKVSIDYLHMRPITSGKTNKSNRNHMIQWWLDKKGTKRTVIQGYIDTPAKARVLEQDDKIVYSTK